MNLTHKLTHGTALVIKGPEGSGKTVLALAIAKQYGAYKHVTARELLSPFDIGLVMSALPKTLVIEMESNRTSYEFRMFIKDAITNMTVEVAQKGGSAQSVPSPHLIFCGNQDCFPINEADRRFQVINLKGQA